eukprot:gene1178-15538_t
MKRSVFKLRMPAKDWVWGPSPHWKIYSSAKKSLQSKNVSVMRGVTKLAGDYQESIIEAYKNMLIKARKAMKPKFSTLHRHGTFGTSTNFLWINSKKKGESFKSRRNFMSERLEVLLSSEEIDKTLRFKEETAFFNTQLTARIDFNELSSNRPMEDQKFAFRSVNDNGIIVGLLDGHGGNSFAEKVKKYLPLYVSAALVDSQFEAIDSFCSSSLVEPIITGPNVEEDSFITNYLLNYIKEVAEKTPVQNDPGTFSMYVRQLLGPTMLLSSEEMLEKKDISDCLKEAFVRLDLDMVNNILESSKSGNLKQNDLGMTSSGCCALVTYLNGSDLHVANSGDCRAVMGSLHDGMWSAIQLTLDHTANSNPEEVQRILLEHPKEESRTCFQYGRLLGRLAPLRAFGDIRFKLDAEQQKMLIGSIDPKFKSFSNLKTPPYLTAEPEVFRYRLEKSDKFVVMATDGLWDMLSNQEVIELVGSYIEGRAADMMLKRAVSASISNLDEVLASQNTSDPEKDNVATFLIRCALGGYDTGNLSAMLTLPYPDVRMYRDDITVAVIFFDHDVNN